MKYGDKIYYYLKNHKLNYCLQITIIFIIKVKGIRVIVIIFKETQGSNINIIHRLLLLINIKNLLLQEILQIMYKISLLGIQFRLCPPEEVKIKLKLFIDFL
jgi:hypothetical protein